MPTVIAESLRFLRDEYGLHNGLKARRLPEVWLGHKARLRSKAWLRSKSRLRTEAVWLRPYAGLRPKAWLRPYTGLRPEAWLRPEARFGTEHLNSSVVVPNVIVFENPLVLLKLDFLGVHCHKIRFSGHHLIWAEPFLIQDLIDVVLVSFLEIPLFLVQGAGVVRNPARFDTQFLVICVHCGRSHETAGTRKGSVPTLKVVPVFVFGSATKKALFTDVAEPQHGELVVVTKVGASATLLHETD